MIAGPKRSGGTAGWTRVRRSSAPERNIFGDARSSSDRDTRDSPPCGSTPSGEGTDRARFDGEGETVGGSLVAMPFGQVAHLDHSDLHTCTPTTDYLGCV